MPVSRRLSFGKYFWLELSFLFFFTLGISIISDLEFSYKEAWRQPETSSHTFMHGFTFRVVSSLLFIIHYGIYYWGFLKRYVFKRSLTGIILCTIGFAIFHAYYNSYFVKWVIAYMEFIPSDLRREAWKDWSRTKVTLNYNYLLIAAVLPLTGLAFFIRSLTQDEQMKQLKEQQLLSELNYLKAQIHPHFFFNTINNIYSLALKQSPYTAPMLARLGEMMRYILYEANQKTVPLSREIAFLSSYIEIEQMRHASPIQIHYDLQGIQPDTQIEPLLLLPFIENAFKHGLEHETAAGYVNIIICQTEEELLLYVANSKPAALPDHKTKGIGLNNVQKRLDLLYPHKHRLAVSDDAGKHEVTLALQKV
jgi:sensor histidine kinase YesM